MSQLFQQLQEAIRELESINKVNAHTAQLKERLVQEEHELELMERTLSKEQRDVEALESEGLSSMFRKFLGDREEKLEKEREEYLRASLKFNELFKSVELIRFELDLLSKKSASIDAVQGKIKTLMQQREEELMRLNGDAAQALRGIHTQSDALQRYHVEVEEAHTAGVKALEFVRSAEHSLHQALLMGQRDMWGGKRYGSGHAKHNYIDHARQMAYQSRHALIRFGNEIKDVFKDRDLEVNMEIEEFGRFTDVFFDNIITDYIIQQKISKSLGNITGTRQRLDLLMQLLDGERSVIREKAEQLMSAREKILQTTEH